MKYNITDAKLKAIIDELGEEYKDLLYEHALDNTSRVYSDDVNTLDLMRIDVQIKSRIRNNRRIQRQNYIFSLTAMLGVLYAFLGLIILMWSELEENIAHNSTMMMAVVLIVIGLFSALSSLVFKTVSVIRPSNYRKRQHIVSPYEIIDKWKTIEALINELTPQENTLSLSSMIDNLYESKIITSQDIETIGAIKKARNMIVHNTEDVRYTQSELRSILSSANNIISRLKRFI